MRAKMIIETMAFKRTGSSKESLNSGIHRKVYPPYEVKNLIDGFYLTSEDFTESLGPNSANTYPIKNEIWRLEDGEWQQVTAYQGENFDLNQVWSLTRDPSREQDIIDLEESDWIRYIGGLEEDPLEIARNLDLGYVWKITGENYWNKESE